MPKENRNSRRNDNRVVEPRINDEIRGYDSARVIYTNTDDESKNFNRVMSLYEAKRTAKDMELDLIEINSKASPAILKIANYSKYLYELKKQLKQKKRNATANTLKEVQLKTNIFDHDLQIKANKAREFIEDGNKVKVVLTMKGRELNRRDESKTCLYKFIDMLSDIAVPESLPKDESNKCIVILKKK